LPPLEGFVAAGAWAWHQWSGTIIERLWRTAAVSMLVPLVLFLTASFLEPDLCSFGKPSEASRLIAPLAALSTGWNHLLTLTSEPYL
jgi:hypothetical protein